MHIKEDKLLQFVYQQKLKGLVPTYRDIRNEIMVSSVSTVSYHIQQLVEKGLLHKKDGEKRCLEVTKLGEKYLGTNKLI